MNQFQAAYKKALENSGKKVSTLKEFISLQNDLKKAEDELISWGLSKMPEAEITPQMRKMIEAPIYRINFINRFLEDCDE